MVAPMIDLVAKICGRTARALLFYPFFVCFVWLGTASGAPRGARVDKSKEVAQTGVAPLPGTTEQALGGHAVLCVGYDDASARFLVRNSWGTGWGMDGYFTLPYTYLTERNLASDFWAIVKVATS